MTKSNVVRIPITFETRLRHAIIWQAQRAARAIVVRELKAQGIRTSLLSTSKITRLTLDYLCRHRVELLAEAEASGVVQHLRLEHERRRIDLEAKSLCSNPVRNGAQQ